MRTLPLARNPHQVPVTLQQEFTHCARLFCDETYAIGLLATVELRRRGELWAFGPAPILEHAPPLPVFGNSKDRQPAENC